MRAIKKLKVMGNGFGMIPVGGSYLVQSVPAELNMDHTVVLQLAEVSSVSLYFVYLPVNIKSSSLITFQYYGLSVRGGDIIKKKENHPVCSCACLFVEKGLCDGE